MGTPSNTTFQVTNWEEKPFDEMGNGPKLVAAQPIAKARLVNALSWRVRRALLPNHRLMLMNRPDIPSRLEALAGLPTL